MNVLKSIKEEIWQSPYGADLVVSFHINSSTSSIARGSEVYVTQNTRIDRFYKNSNQLAVNVLNNLANIGIPRNGKFSAKLRPTESGNRYPDGSYADYYGIIRYPMNYGIPGVLIEHCFISNAADRNFINNDSQINRIAQADAQAIIANKELFRIDKNKNAVKGALDSIYYDSNTGSIKGKVLYNEVINDMSVDTTPKMRLISTDGTQEAVGEISKTGQYTYSYKINIMNLNPYKEYVLQVETKDKSSIPQNNTIALVILDGRLGTIYGMEIDCKDSKIIFNAPPYDGMVNSYSYTELSINGTRIEGKIVVQEWLNNGTTQAQPKVNPNVFLVAEDGTKIQCEVGRIEPYIYGISCQEQYIDKTKKYQIQVEAGTEKNISPKREMVVQYGDKELGLLGIYTTKIQNNQLIFDYNGYMTNSPYSGITLNGNKISGRLVVQEWLNGTKQIEPTSQPKLVIKNASNTVVAQTTLKYIEPYVYSYEMDVGILGEGEYTFEVQGTNPTNTSNHQNVVTNYSNQEIGTIGNDVLKIENGKLIRIEKKNKYNGYMTNSPYSKITLNGNKISGKLVVQEWLNGTKQIEPTTLPRLVVKDNSGIVVAQTTLKYIEPYVYSYEMDIGILGEGEYTFEVQGTNSNNISDHQNVEVNYTNQEIGTIGNTILTIENGKLIKKEKSDKYDGYMTNSPYSNITLNENKISGRLVVQEWLNGTKQIEPTTLPRLVVKDNSGIVVAQTTLKYVEPYVYSYEMDIGTLGEGEYTFEVQGTNSNNISDHQNVIVEYRNQDIGNTENYRISIENKTMLIKSKEVKTIQKEPQQNSNEGLIEDNKENEENEENEKAEIFTKNFGEELEEVE